MEFEWTASQRQKAQRSLRRGGRDAFRCERLPDGRSETLQKRIEILLGREINTGTDFDDLVYHARSGHTNHRLRAMATISEALQ